MRRTLAPSLRSAGPRSAGPRAASFRGMLTIGAIGVVVSLGGCAPKAQPKAPPQKQAERSAPRREAPLHVSPPPDYGNKIVLADSESDDEKL